MQLNLQPGGGHQHWYYFRSICIRAFTWASAVFGERNETNLELNPIAFFEPGNTPRTIVAMKLVLRIMLTICLSTIWNVITGKESSIRTCKLIFSMT